MPLRAFLDDKTTHSFDFSNEEWVLLKETYRDKSLTMHCCDRKAIPKTSKLGTKYFAHAKRGDCTSNPETKEHIYLKNLIANIAKTCGWKVTTEHSGETPDGETWIADVFCQKGNGKLAFEVQWTPQNENEYLRRTEKYKASGVRCAWLYRIKGRGENYHSHSSDSHTLPCFGFRHKDGNFIVSRYDTPIADFIKGMFQGELSWCPKPNEPLTINLHHEKETCWKCKRQTNIITSLSVSSSSNATISSVSFSDEGIADWIAHNIPKRLLWNNNIGTVKERYSKTVRGRYMSNGCFHCDALQGNFYISHHWDNEVDESEPVTYSWIYSPNTLKIQEGWFFKGQKGLVFY